MTHLSHYHRTSEQRWDEAYPLLPAQYAELSRGSEPIQPERRLMLAVLSDAIVLFQTRAPAVPSAREHDCEEARRWILSNDRAWPYSFVNVCEALGIAFQPLRRALVTGRRRASGIPGRAAGRRRLLAGVMAEPLAQAG
jgi:hypothetical protein